jgi:hypothetical protein
MSLMFVAPTQTKIHFVTVPLAVLKTLHAAMWTFFFFFFFFFFFSVCGNETVCPPFKPQHSCIGSRLTCFKGNVVRLCVFFFVFGSEWFLAVV